MSITKQLKDSWLKINPFAKARRNRMRSELRNNNITLLCPNCMGGILFHDLGLRFNSPTVNLMIYQTDFLKFVLNLDEYVNGNLVFFNHDSFNFPCAYLCAEGLERIAIHFTHFKTEEEALAKWTERKKRINKDNLFIFIEERDGITKEELQTLAKLNVKGIVAFTCNKYEDIPYSVYIDKYHADGEVGNILLRNYFDDSREYEHFFDFIGWFNKANGRNYDVSAFIK